MIKWLACLLMLALWAALGWALGSICDWQSDEDDEDNEDDKEDDDGGC